MKRLLPVEKQVKEKIPDGITIVRLNGVSDIKKCIPMESRRLSLK